MSSKLQQIINYPGSNPIKRDVEFIDIPALTNPSINITDTDFDLYSTFSTQLLRTKQKFKLKALDEFFKLYLQAIVVLDSEKLGFINDYEKKILRKIIEDYELSKKSSTLELKEKPLGKKALIEGDLCILKSENLLILFRKADYNEQEDLLSKISMLITLFNQPKKK